MSKKESTEDTPKTGGETPSDEPKSLDGGTCAFQPIVYVVFNQRIVQVGDDYREEPEMAEDDEVDRPIEELPKPEWPEPSGGSVGSHRLPKKITVTVEVD